jgi:GGDEF domain-containing protein
MDEAAIRGPLEKSVETEEELQVVLQKVVGALQNRGVDESKLQRIYDEILGRKTGHKKAAGKKTADEEAADEEIAERETEKGMPKGTFNRGTLLFFLKKELSRARRYKTPFSTLTFAIVKASPNVPVVPGSIKRNEILNEVLKRLLKIVRDIDLIGVLDENRICVLLPMTPEAGSKLAHRRILKAFHAESFALKNISLQVKLAAVSTAFHTDRTPTMQAFVKAIEIEMNELMKPVKSWFILDKMRE